MPTEEWDTNTVTDILGVRAFGTQLLREQVVGRGLGRQSYDLNTQTGLSDVNMPTSWDDDWRVSLTPQRRTAGSSRRLTGRSPDASLRGRCPRCSRDVNGALFRPRLPVGITEACRSGSRRSHRAGDVTPTTADRVRFVLQEGDKARSVEEQNARATRLREIRESVEPISPKFIAHWEAREAARRSGRNTT